MTPLPHPSPGAGDAEPPPAGMITGNDIRVDLAGHVLPLAELRARPERYRAWFAAARRTPGFARCLCTRPAQRLVIRELGPTFHLARWPDTADDHIPGCSFFSTASRHSGAGAHRDAISVTDQGTRIAVDITFTSAVAAPETATPDDAYTLPPSPVATQLDGSRRDAATITLGGLLQWLWETAGLNVAPTTTLSTSPTAGRPNRRSWSDCSAALIPLVAALRLGDDPAVQRLHVVATYRPAKADTDDDVARALAQARDTRLAAFLRPLEHPETTTIRGGPRRGRTRHLRHRRLVLGELKDLTETGHGHKLALRHFPRPLFLTSEQHTHLNRTYPAAFSKRCKPQARRIVLALVEGTPHGYLRLVDAAILLTDAASYIPADSSHELAMVAALSAAGRAFFKPLRYGGAGVHPDFVLTDTTPPTVVEVRGITGRETYENRRAAKEHNYRNSGTPLLTWDVYNPLPVIPAAPEPGNEQPAGK